MIVVPSTLTGSVRVPGDKSVTHRAILFASVAEGTSEIVDPGAGADNLSTLSAIRALGVPCSFDDAAHITVEGRGLGGLVTPSAPIDCGNSGTTARMLAGMLAGAGISASLVGDASLSRRPMGRVAAPLTDMGYDVRTGEGGLLPLEIRPTATPVGGATGVRAVLKVASAQVKSCILLSGLWRGTPTQVIEPVVSRDHSERLMRAMGLRVTSTAHYLDPAGHERDADAPTVTLHPGGRLQGRSLQVPGDPSSAAFLVAAALLRGDGVTVRRVCTNPTRLRFLDVVRRMGGAVSTAQRLSLTTGEPAADIDARRSSLRATEVSGFEVPLVIDEIPILCVLGAASTGRFVVRDAEELRVKESDRVERTAELLRALGIRVDTRPDGLEFDGLGAASWDAFSFACGDDHRIAMAAIVAGLAARGPCALSETECVAVSFPSFAETLGALGAEIRA